ncbi:GNAT family N-acetyltransferase [bacterium]|nr:GNAT family N-acetyltransferase [bacterium]
MITIRDYLDDDLDDCVSLFTTVFSQPPWNDRWPSFEAAKIYLKDIIHAPRFKGLVMYHDARLVGACLGRHRIWWAGDEFYIDEFFIANSLQRKGLGTRLMDYLMQVVHDDGVRVVFLMTAHGTPAEFFYQKLGFKISTRMQLMYLPIRKEP